MHDVTLLSRLSVLSMEPQFYFFSFNFQAEVTAVLEEYLLSILIAISRHSPVAANAIVECPMLLETIVSRFTMENNRDFNPCKIKSIILFKVNNAILCFTLSDLQIYKQTHFFNPHFFFFFGWERFWQDLTRNVASNF